MEVKMNKQDAEDFKKIFGHYKEVEIEEPSKAHRPKAISIVDTKDIQMYHMPNFLITSKIFSSKSLGNYTERERIVEVIKSNEKVDTTYEGVILDQFDCQVFTVIQTILCKSKDFKLITTMEELCNLLQLSIGEENYNKIWNSLQCLYRCSFILSTIRKGKRDNYAMGHLINNVVWDVKEEGYEGDKKNCKIAIELNEGTFKMVDLGFTKIELNYNDRIKTINPKAKRDNLADSLYKWVKRYEFGYFNLNLEEFKDKLSRKESTMNNFKRDLSNALKKLGLIKDKHWKIEKSKLTREEIFSIIKG